MDLWLNIAFLNLGLLGALTAIGGETWKRDEPRPLRRVTLRGWLAVVCLLFSLIVGAVREVRVAAASQRNDAERVRLGQELAAANARLDMAKKEILQSQQGTYEIVKHTTLAILDLQTPSPYRDLPSLRLGLMWYALGYKPEALYHFRLQAALTPRNAQALFNLGVTNAAMEHLDAGCAVFAKVPTDTLGPNRRRLLEVWRQACVSGRPAPPGEAWAAWRLP
jgi:hypothetical protein